MGCLQGAGNYAVGVSGLIPVTNGSLIDSYSNESYIPVGASSNAAAAVREAPKATTAAPARRRSPRISGSSPRTDF
jgi:hypothetical protein